MSCPPYFKTFRSQQNHPYVQVMSFSPQPACVHCIRLPSLEKGKFDVLWENFFRKSNIKVVPGVLKIHNCLTRHTPSLLPSDSLSELVMKLTYFRYFFSQRNPSHIKSLFLFVWSVQVMAL